MTQKRFGKYTLIEQIAVGGMAEVYMAKLSGAESFERLLAIKVMKPELAADEEFSRMFVDEARIAGQLTHPNVAQIFELGRVEHQLYIVMELVEGRDVGDIIQRANDCGMKIPVGFAAHVVGQAALGLDHAHRRMNPQGEPLGIIHRDVNPRNLIVSWQGAVKVVDFGIAKAAGDAVKTRVGVIKGKFSYLAPEQVKGQPLDRRTDVFNLGNVLYEIVTGKKLYAADNDFEILNRAKLAKLPNFKAIEGAPEELVEVLTKAMAPKRKDRYEWASELATAIDPLRIEGRSIFGPQEAALFMEELYSTERDADQQKATDALESMLQKQVDDDFGFDSEDEFTTTKTETFMSTFVSRRPTPTMDDSFSMPEAVRVPSGEFSMPGAMSPASSGSAPPPSGAFGDSADSADSDHDPLTDSGSFPTHRPKSASVRRPSQAQSPNKLYMGLAIIGIVFGVLLGTLLLSTPSDPDGPDALGTTDETPVVGENLVDRFDPQPEPDEPQAQPEPTPDGREDGEAAVTAEKRPDKPKSKPKPKITHGWVRLKIKAKKGKGARVWVGKNMVGKVPLTKTIKLKLGTHTVKVEKKGKTTQRKVTVGRMHADKKKPASVSLTF